MRVLLSGAVLMLMIGCKKARNPIEFSSERVSCRAGLCSGIEISEASSVLVLSSHIESKVSESYTLVVNVDSAVNEVNLKEVFLDSLMDGYYWKHHTGVYDRLPIQFKKSSWYQLYGVQVKGETYYGYLFIDEEFKQKFYLRRVEISPI